MVLSTLNNFFLRECFTKKIPFQSVSKIRLTFQKYCTMRYILLLGIFQMVYCCKTLQQVGRIADDIRNTFMNSPRKMDFMGGALRLAFHDAGTFDLISDTGGPNGCVPMQDDDNKGLEVVLALLQPLREKHKGVCTSQADFWTLAASVAVDMALERKNGISLVRNFKMGRRQKDTCDDEMGRLPKHTLGMEHITQVFETRMGFTKSEVVALMGAHTIGRAHKNASGFNMAWDSTPTRFDNKYYQGLLKEEWARAVVKQSGKKFWVDPINRNKITKKENMMLNTDMVLAWDIGSNNASTIEDAKNSCQVQWHAHLKLFLDKKAPWKAIAPLGSKFCSSLPNTSVMRNKVQEYANDEKTFIIEFEAAFQKLMALGYSDESSRGALCTPCLVEMDCCCGPTCPKTLPPKIVKQPDTKPTLPQQELGLLENLESALHKMFNMIKKLFKFMPQQLQGFTNFSFRSKSPSSGCYNRNTATVYLDDASSTVHLDPCV